jgi:hypothetical protein
MPMDPTLMPPDAAPPEKRGRQRLPLPLVARIERRSPSGRTSLVMGCTRDVSNRGAYLWSPVPFASGESVELKLEVPPDQGRNWTMEIRCQAEVTRVEPSPHGGRHQGVAVRILSFEIRQVTVFVPRIRPNAWVN